MAGGLAVAAGLSARRRRLDDPVVPSTATKFSPSLIVANYSTMPLYTSFGNKAQGTEFAYYRQSVARPASFLVILSDRRMQHRKIAPSYTS